MASVLSCCGEDAVLCDRLLGEYGRAAVVAYRLAGALAESQVRSDPAGLSANSIDHRCRGPNSDQLGRTDPSERCSPAESTNRALLGCGETGSRAQAAGPGLEVSWSVLVTGECRSTERALRSPRLPPTPKAIDPIALVAPPTLGGIRR